MSIISQNVMINFDVNDFDKSLEIILFLMDIDKEFPFKAIEIGSDFIDMGLKGFITLKNIYATNIYYPENNEKIIAPCNGFSLYISYNNSNISLSDIIKAKTDLEFQAAKVENFYGIIGTLSVNCTGV